MRSSYASDTSVSTERSRTEIERTLMRFGANKFQYGWDGDRAVIMFDMNDRVIRFELPIPSRTDFEKTPNRGRTRSAEAVVNAWEQAQRARFRALALAIKAKLVAVEEGITEFEEEFLAHIVLPGGQTVGQMARPQVAEAYASKRAPRFLLTDGKH